MEENVQPSTIKFREEGVLQSRRLAVLAALGIFSTLLQWSGSREDTIIACKREPNCVRVVLLKTKLQVIANFENCEKGRCTYVGQR